MVRFQFLFRFRGSGFKAVPKFNGSAVPVPNDFQKFFGTGTAGSGSGTGSETVPVPIINWKKFKKLSSKIWGIKIL